MYIFEINDLVYYIGDLSDPLRNKRSLAIVEKIDESKFPWIGVRLFPSNELIGVRYELIRSIETKEAHLKKLGFTENTIQNRLYFERDGVCISDIYVVIKPNHLYIPKFRIIPNLSFEIDLTKYLKDGTQDAIDDNKFNEDYPDANNLNHLIRTLNGMGIKTPSIEELDELMPKY